MLSHGRCSRCCFVMNFPCQKSFCNVLQNQSEIKILFCVITISCSLISPQTINVSSVQNKKFKFERCYKIMILVNDKLLKLWQYNKIKRYSLIWPSFCLFFITTFKWCSYFWLMNFSKCHGMSFLIVILLTSKPCCFNVLSSKKIKDQQC